MLSGGVPRHVCDVMMYVCMVFCDFSLRLGDKYTFFCYRFNSVIFLLFLFISLFPYFFYFSVGMGGGGVGFGIFSRSAQVQIKQHF